MRRATTAVCFLFLAGLGREMVGQAGPPPGRVTVQRPQEPVAREQVEVTFRVIDEQTGAPIARALVEHSGKGGMTGETGEVVLTMQKDGGGVVVRRPGYEAQTVGMAPSPVVVKLQKLALVRGRVTDRHQEPVVGLKVEAIERQIRDGWRSKRVYTWCDTNDLGEYRLGELRPGDWEIRVAGKTSAVIVVGLRPGDRGIRERYRSVSEQFELRPGEVREQPFQVEMEPAFLVRGQVVNYSKRAVPKVELRGADGTPVAARFTMNYESGAFEFRDVAPGEYSLTAKVQSEGDGSGPGIEVPVTVAKEDVANVAIELTEPAPVEVVSRGCEQAKRMWLSVTRVSRVNAGFGIAVSGPVVEQKMQGRGLTPGRYELEWQSSGCVPYAMRAGEQDVMANGLVVSPGMDKVRLDVEFGAGGYLNVKLPERKEAEPLTVLLMPVNAKGLHPRAWPGLGELWQPGRLSPGEYIVAAWPVSRELAYREDDVQELIRRHGVRVAVAAGGTAEVELRELIP